MSGFLLVAPTGSGKSWACKNNHLLKQYAIDGDPLINWNLDWSRTDWTIQDRKHIDIVLKKAQSTGKCICWYVGTTAVADAINEGRICANRVIIVLLPEDEHRRYVEKRGKRNHGWSKALEHRKLCEQLIANYGVLQFSSFDDAAEHLKNQKG